MRFERAESDPPTEGSNGHKDICVLVVDCDPTSLMTISGMLRALTYQVVTVERVTDALAMILERKDEVDLVMTELHMPDMDGLQLLDEIQKLQNCLLLEDKQLQKTGQKGGVQVESLGENESDVDAGSALISNGKHGYQEPTTDTVETDKDDDDEEDTLTSPIRKKAKLTWTTELHDKFLLAIDAHPKKILHLMGVEGLTKEHISSHLQKYRLSVKRDKLAVQSVLEFATKKTTMDYFGSRNFVPYRNQTVYNISHGIQAPKLLPPTMASQPGFTAYIQTIPVSVCMDLTRLQWLSMLEEQTMDGAATNCSPCRVLIIHPSGSLEQGGEDALNLGTYSINTPCEVDPSYNKIGSTLICTLGNWVLEYHSLPLADFGLGFLVFE
ncbi:Two-component response regulator ARR2 [Vitis vinifera]|uniref:Two-component response regulator ARR2 n=1 Tax=Vitis vinifera TaxID=29760 RepID=A0A438DZW9_VITVI|nr:Two-component response regulator ARR2 [Vitis vinifera]